MKKKRVIPSKFYYNHKFTFKIGSIIEFIILFPIWLPLTILYFIGQAAERILDSICDFCYDYIVKSIIIKIYKKDYIKIMKLRYNKDDEEDN